MSQEEFYQQQPDDAFQQTFQYTLTAGPRSRMNSDDSGYDDSLTDIRWLGSMDAGINFPAFDNSDKGRLRTMSKSRGKTGICKKLSYDKKEEKSDAHKLRPPFSYAALISLAISSHPQKMLTLNSIYRWIESHFPFFRMPEAKAWKNSIRHNLSIKKSMFQKVYLDPPRRGNGAYWTLLPEGQEEVQRCIKLFSTLQPPVVDDLDSALPIPSSSGTHTVRSRGQFVPARVCSNTVEVKSTKQSDQHHNLLESHSRAVSEFDSSFGKENLFHPHLHPPSIQPFNPGALLPSNPSIAPVAASSYHDTSTTTLLDSSFLTPMKENSSLMQEVDINTISLSPFFSFLHSSTDAKQHPHTTPYYGIQLQAPSTHNFTPLTPSKQANLQEGDSGTYSPLGLKFCTPDKDLQLATCTLSDLVQPSNFSTPSKGLCSPLVVQDQLTVTPTGTPAGLGAYLNRTLPNSLSPLCYDGRHQTTH